MLHSKIKQISVGLMMAALMVSSAAFVNRSHEPAVRTIEITGTDQMKFDVSSIEAVPGERIRIVFKVISRLPKAAMAHNVVLLDKDADVKAFVNASARAMDNQYIAPEYKDQVIAATALAGGGETVEVIFTVPKEPGQYTYVCTFPGHYYGGMKGVLTVKQTVG